MAQIAQLARPVIQAQERANKGCEVANKQSQAATLECKAALQKKYDEDPWLGYLFAFAILALWLGPVLWKRLRRKDYN